MSSSKAYDQIRRIEVTTITQHTVIRLSHENQSHKFFCTNGVFLFRTKPFGNDNENVNSREAPDCDLSPLNASKGFVKARIKSTSGRLRE